MQERWRGPGYEFAEMDGLLANRWRTGKFLRLLGVQTSTTEGSGGSTDVFAPLLKHSVHVNADWESSTNQA